MNPLSEAEQFKHLTEPFSFNYGPVGCLLLHGYTSSPSEMRPLGEFLAQNGYSVICPLFPGHGTTPEDLDKTSWRDWYDAAYREFTRMRQVHKQVFIIGLSMGGVLALHIAAHSHVDGVIGLSTGTRLVDWRLTLLPLLRHFFRRVRKTHNDYARGPNRIRFAYDYNSVKPTRELLLLYQHVEDDLPEVHIPLLLIHSKNDIIVDADNAELIRSKVRSTDVSVILLEHARHIITLSEEKDAIHSAVLQFLIKYTQHPNNS